MREALIDRILKFIERRSLFVILATLLISLVMGWFAFRVRMTPDVISLVPADEKANRLMQEYGQGRVQPEYLLVAAEAEEIFDLQKLAAFARAVERIEALPAMRPGVTPFNLMTLEKDGARLKIVTAGPGGGPPDTPESLRLFRERLRTSPLARNLVLSADGTTLAAFFPTGEIADYTKFVENLREVLAELENEFPRVYAYGPMLYEEVSHRYLTRDLPKLLALAGIFIILVYYLGFRSRRALLLPLLVVAVGTLWTIGFMSMAGYAISVISIITPPLVLTLGSSYSIHILNQYYREARPDSRDCFWITRAVARVNKTILLAAGTTVIGFASLLVTNLRQTREFGIATSAGIVSCALLSLFFFPAVLSRLSPPSPVHRKKILEGRLSRGMEHLSRLVLRHRVVIFLLLLMVVACFFLLIHRVEHHSDYITYFPPQEKVVQDTYRVYEKLGGFQQVYITVTAPETGAFLSPGALKKIEALESRLERNPDISYVMSFVTYLRQANQVMTGREKVPEKRALIRLLSTYFRALAGRSGEAGRLGLLADEDFSRLTVSLRIYDSAAKGLLFEKNLRRLVAELETDIAETLPPDYRAEIWGTCLSFLSVSDMIDRDQRVSMLISLLLIFTITALAFRSLRYGLLALIPLVTGIMLNYIFMALSGTPMDMTTSMVSCVAIGVGVDNAIHFLIQFRRQLRLFPEAIDKVLSHTLRIAGRPILLTTVSTVGGLLLLALASFRPIIYFGLLVAMALFTTAVGTLVILPAVLSMGYMIRNGKTRRGPARAPDLFREWS
jgi:hydrophobe/amphiphile efflux-3 (HAE3) family protein